MYQKSWNNLLIWGLSFNVLLNFKRLDSNYLKRTESQCLLLRKNNSEILLNHGTLLLLFDCYVGGIINYASEIWGIQKGNYAEKLHLDIVSKVGIGLLFMLLCAQRQADHPLLLKKKRSFQILKDVLYKVMIILFKSV